MKQEPKKWDEKLKNFTQNKKRLDLVVALGLCGILLLLLSEFSLGGGKAGKTTQANQPADTTGNYAKELSDQLEQLLGQMQGVGKIQVMLTLESGSQAVYATTVKTSTTTNGLEQQQNTTQQSYEDDYVLVDGADGKQALVEVTQMPEVRGVVVLCEGAGDIATVKQVTDAVSVVLGVSTNRICVSKLS